MNQNFSIDTTPLTRTEAEEWKAKIRVCMANLTSHGDTLGELLYEFLTRNGPEALGIDRAELRRKLAKKKGVHRSTVYRLYDWVLVEIRLGLAHGELKEYPARTLKTKVRKDAWNLVLDEALKEKGSFEAITAPAILVAAEKFRCLKQPSGGESKPNKQAHGNQPRASASPDAKTSAVPDRVRAFQASRDQWTKSLNSCKKQLLKQARSIFEAADALSPDERRRVYRGLRRELSRPRNPSS